MDSRPYRFFTIYIFRLVLAGFLLLSGCRIINPLPQNKAETLPNSEVAHVKMGACCGFFIFNEKHIKLGYVDGVSIYEERSGSDFMSKRLLPGKHTLGLYVSWGTCLPTFPSACLNQYYSAVKIVAEAGRTYGYALEKTKDDIFVIVSDDTGKIVSKGLCEKCTWAACGIDQVKSINERVEKEPEVESSPK